MNQHVLNVRLTNNSVLGSTNDEPGTPTVIGLLKQAYNKLNTSTGNTNLILTILQNKITSLENTVNGSESTNPPIEGLTARVSDLEDVTDDQSTAIRNNADNISLNASNITTERGRIDTLNTSLSNLSSNISTAITDLTNRITAVDKIDPNDVAHGRLKVVEDQVDHLEINVADLVAEVEGQGGALDDIIDLQADVSLLQQTVNGLHAGVGENTNQTGGERFNLYESNRNNASGDYSHAEGYLTQATGSYSHAEGSSNMASGNSTHVEGSLNTASGSYSHAEGYKTQATGSYSHAEGYAYNNSSTSYGARGTGSHVEGYNCLTTTNANYGHAEGYMTKASNSSTHAEGYETEAHGQYSHASGYNTYADTYAITVVGRNNTYNPSIPAAAVDRLFVVGNGTGTSSSARSDAFVVHNNGSVIINSTASNTTPSLTIGTSKAITGTTAASSSQAYEDDVLVTKYYANNDLLTIFMNIVYPVDSIYFSHNPIDLYDDQGNLSGTGKPLTPTRGPLDFGTWYQINWDCDNNYSIGLLPRNATISGNMRGDKKLSIRHLPAHAHMGIWTPDGARPSGSGGTACVPANTTSGNNPRWNETAVIPNSLGDSPNGASYTNYGPSNMQTPLQPYGYYCYMYRKVSLS